MDRLSKIKLAIEKGYTCDPNTGEVFGLHGKTLKNKDKKGYIIIGLSNNVKLLAHIFIYYCVHQNIDLNCEIDHIDKNPSNNKIDNLREVTRQQNQFNRSSTQGCSITKSGKFQSRIKIDGKIINLGLYENQYDAKNAYLEAKKLYHVI